MTQATGSQAQILIGEESTYGAIPGTPAMTKINCALPGESLGSTREELVSGAINPSRMVLATRIGNEDMRGSLPTEVSPEGGFPLLIKHLLGYVNTSGTGPMYDHAISTAALPTSLYIEKGFTDVAQYFRFAGVRINSANFSINPQGLITCSFDLIGASLISTAATSLDATPTDPTHEPIVHHDASLIQEGGSATAAILGIDLTISNNLDADRYRVGSARRTGLPEGTLAVTGTATFLFEDLSIVTKWENETETDMQFSFQSPSANAFDITMERVKYTGDAVPKIETPGGVIIAPTFRAIYDGVFSDISINFHNTEASIPA